MESNLKLSERIIGEYYFVKDDLQVVVSISTTKQRWRNVQSDFKQFLNLFWVGVIKETEIKYQNDYSNWEMDGTNSSNPNYIKATPQIHRPLTQQWVQQIKTDASLQTKSVIANNMFILMDSAKLTAIKISSGDMLWSFDLNHQFRKDFISIKNNLIFLIQEIPKKQIVALIPETGEIIQKIPVSNLVGAPVFTQDSIVFYDTNKLWSFHIALSNLNWSKDLSIAENGYLTAINDHLICQLDTGEIVNIDTQTGDIKWTSYKKYDLSNKPVLTEDQIILPVEHKRKIDDRLIALTLSDGVENWQFKKPLLKMEITQSPSINGDVIICPTQIKYKDQESKERSDFVLFSIDPKNGAVFWQKSYTPDTQKRPIITENVVYINNLNQEVMLFDSLTGEIIPTAMNQFKPAELLFSFQLRPYKNLVIKTIHKDKLIEIICES